MFVDDLNDVFYDVITKRQVNKFDTFQETA